MKDLIESISFSAELDREDRESDMSSPTVCAEALAAYHKQRVDGALPSDSVWKIHTDRSQKKFLQLLEGNDAGKLADYVRNIHKEHVLIGYDQHLRTTEKIAESRAVRVTNAKIVSAALARLCSGLGVVRNFHPLHRENFTYTVENETEQMVIAAAEALDLQGDFPRTAVDAYGLRTPLGLLVHRHVLALGYLREIRAILKQRAGKYRQVVEIGGGLGRVAFHIARDLRMPCTIIDIPAVSVTQFLFLRGNGRPATLWENAMPEPGSVRLLNAFAPLDPEMVRDALFVNFDSFVEMAKSTQDGYFDLIAQSGGDLLSVNHEWCRAMTPDGDLHNWNIGRFADWGYKAGPRYPFWEREGYVSQFFERNSG